MRKVVFALVLMALSGSLLADLSEEADKIADNIAALILRTEKILKECEKIERTSADKKEMLAFQNTYSTLSAEAGLMSQVSGSGGTIAPDLGSIAQVVKRIPGMRFNAEMSELVKISELFFRGTIDMIKKLHDEHIMTYKLCLIFRHIQRHAGFNIYSAIFSDPFTRNSAPTIQIKYFIDLLQQTLRCVLVYASGRNKTIDNALSIDPGIESPMPFANFDV